MKYSATSLFLLISAFLFAPSTLAHPGHDVTAHGPAHLLTSPYHVSIILGVSLLSFFIAALLRKSWLRSFQLSAAAAFCTALLLWIAQ